MPHLIAIEYSEAQRRQLSSKISELSTKGWPLSAKYDAQTFGTWEKLFENSATPGLFVQREVIVVENAEILDTFPEKLTPLLEDENADTIIILVFSTDSKNLKAVTKQINLIKPEPQIPQWKRQAWITSLAKEEGSKISPDAAQLLAENIESQEELRGEILKLSLYAEGREITLEDAENLSFDEGGRAMMTLLDGLCADKPDDVAKALRHLRDEPLLPVLTALANRLRPALIISCFQGNYTENALKAAGFDPSKKSYAINKAKSALKFFGADKIKTFMAKSARLSFLEKTSRAEGWQGLELIIWELMTKI